MVSAEAPAGEEITHSAAMWEMQSSIGVLGTVGCTACWTGFLGCEGSLRTESTTDESICILPLNTGFHCTESAAGASL